MRVTIVLVFCVVVCSCGLLSPEQQQTALDSIDQMKAMGTITQAQYEALRESILSSGIGAWWQQAASTVAGAALAYFGVQARRGPVASPEERIERRKAASSAPLA